MKHAVLPPAVIGVIGGGQLGMMTVREAQRMGYRTMIWDPDPECPAARLADESVVSPFNDRHAASSLASRSDVVTYEFENIDAGIVRFLEETKQVRPGSEILRISQNRRLEKDELKRKGFPVVEYEIVTEKGGLHKAVDRMGLPLVVKTTSTGYDGKGQTILTSQKAVEITGEEMTTAGREFVVEKFLDLACELSVIIIRDADRAVWNFPVAQNTHRENILHTSLVPAAVSEDLQNQAITLARTVIERLEVVGVLCVEMFLTNDGKILVNEIAPRPHNSGHYSLDGCDLSQFEALVRVVTGLPMRQPRLYSPCAIVNLLGKHVYRLDISALQKLPGTKLHLYGKKRNEPKRKMGHVSILRETHSDVLEGIQQVEKMIGEYRRSGPSRPEKESLEVG